MTPRIASMALTRSGLRIGIATVPRQQYTHSADASRLQAALLDARTIAPASLLARVLGAAWRWC